MSKTVLYLDETLKMLRETCCVAQTALDYSAAGGSRGEEHIERLQRVIAEIDRQRPLGVDGTHGDLHTRTCGCEDAPAPATPRLLDVTDGVLRGPDGERL